MQMPIAGMNEKCMYCKPMFEAAAAVPALPGIALGVLVRQDGALRLQDGQAREVLRRDELQASMLARDLALHRIGDLRIGLTKG